MICPEMRSLFSSHMDGLLTPEQEDQLGEHLVSCVGCRTALGEYEASLHALAGASPAPPQALEARVRDALQAEGLLRDRWRPGLRALVPIAASLVIFLLGVSLGHRHVPSGPGIDAGWAQVAAPAGCLADLERHARLDVDALRTPRVVAGERLLKVAGGRSLRLPASLVSRGPYGLDTSSDAPTDGVTCVPLTAAYGDALLLSAAPMPQGAQAPAAAFSVEGDSTRVLYSRVRWVRDDTVWILEGRATPIELLELAEELAGKTRQEKH